MWWCLFAEGQISRTGNLLEFKRGFEVIVKGLDVPVIPVNLDGCGAASSASSTAKCFSKSPPDPLPRDRHVWRGSAAAVTAAPVVRPCWIWERRLSSTGWRAAVLAGRVSAASQAAPRVLAVADSSGRSFFW